MIIGALHIVPWERTAHNTGFTTKQNMSLTGNPLIITEELPHNMSKSFQSILSHLVHYLIFVKNKIIKLLFMFFWKRGKKNVCPMFIKPFSEVQKFVPVLDSTNK